MLGLILQVLLFLIGINIVTFLAYGLDKKSATRKGWRVPEKTLHLLALFGGTGGAYAGQRYFRHKTKKGSFQSVFLGIVILHVIMIIAVFLAAFGIIEAPVDIADL